MVLRRIRGAALVVGATALQSSQFAIERRRLAIGASASEIFACLADDYVLVDPSGGTCCRNECASCSFYETNDAEVTYAFEELRDGRRYLPSYARTEIPPREHEATWARLLFGEGAKTISRDAFKATLMQTGGAEEEDVDVAWRALTTAPVLSKSEMAARLKQISPVGVDEAAFAAAMADAPPAPSGPEIDYESMETPELKALCLERGIKRPPPVRRLICEELRFFDVHGRPGVRNRRTRKLEAP